MRQVLKNTLVSLALLSSVAAVARVEAADLGSNRSSYSTPMLTANWAGLYAGAHIGYGFGRSRNADMNGFIGGLHLGFNLQTDRLVYGVEGDFNYSGVDYRGFTDTFRQKWTGSLRGRVGYAYDRFLPFFTGGFDFSNAHMKGGGAKADNTHAGFVVGVGAEAMVTEKISATVQLLHHRNGAKTYNILPGARSANIVTNELRIGFNYRF